MEVDNLNQTYQTQKNFWRYATSQKNTEIVVKTEQVDEAEEVIEKKDSTDVKIEPAEMVDATATASNVRQKLKRNKEKRLQSMKRRLKNAKRKKLSSKPS